MLLRTTSLVLKELFSCILSVLTRLVRLISTKTKEYLFGRHLFIRSIESYFFCSFHQTRYSIWWSDLVFPKTCQHNLFKFPLVFSVRSQWVGACNSHTKPMSRYFLLTDLFLQYTFSFAKERKKVKLVSCDLSREFHSREIRSKNKSVYENAVTEIQCSCSLLLISSWFSKDRQASRFAKETLNSKSKGSRAFRTHENEECDNVCRIINNGEMIVQLGLW